MAKVINTYTNATQSLVNVATDNPATVTSTGTIIVNSPTAFASGLFGNNTFGWTVANLGTVESIGSNGLGINLSAGGIVTNGSSGGTSGLVVGVASGIQIGGTTGQSSTVVNYGVVRAVSTGTQFANAVLFFSQSGTAAPVGTVVNAGTIFTGALGSSGATAINLNGGGLVVNTGLINAAYGPSEAGVGSFTTGATAAVVNSGTILAVGATAGIGLNLTGGSVNNTGLISASSLAVRIGAGNAAIVNSGTIRGTGTAGGVNLSGAGTIHNTGTISAAGTNASAIQLNNSGGLIVNGQPGSTVGLISGYRTGVGFSVASTVANAGTATLVNYGLIESTQTAVVNGTINGFAVQFGTSAAGGVTNFGTITAAETNGGGAVLLQGGGALVNGSNTAKNALISAVSVGVQVNNVAGTVTNFGTIATSTTGTVGQAVQFSAGGTVVNYGLISGARIGALSGTVTGYGAPIGISGAAGTVLNSGTISTTNYSNGINISASGLFINNASGELLTSRNGIYIGGSLSVPITGAVGTVLNYGVIQSGRNGLSLVSGGTAVNHGVISAQRTGISFSFTAGTVINFGTVAHTGTGTTGEAIYLGGGGTVVNYGLLSGAATGAPAVNGTGGYPGVVDTKGQRATFINFGTVTNPNNSSGVTLLAGGLLVNGSTSTTAALISAPHKGVYIGGTSGIPTPGAIGTVVNYGTIQNSSTAAPAVNLASGGTVVNRGLIAGARTGISLQNTAGTVANFGTIVGNGPTTFTAGSGVYLQAGGVLTNAAGASITALRAGVSVGNTTTTAGSVTIVNSGTISGTIGIAIGVFDAGVATIANYGTIIGSGGKAIRLGTVGNEVLIIGSGSSLQGAVSNLLPGDTVDLPFLPFASGGSAAVGGGNQLQVSESSGSFTLALDPAQSFAGDTFQLSADATGGTLITEIAPPPAISPAVLNNFGWAQGWGSPDNPRFTADVNGDGSSDYLGFGFSTVFIAYGGTFAIGQGPTGPGFSNAVAAVNDFGTNQGYTAQVQRGVAVTGSGFGDSIYGQGFAGVFWYGATGQSPATDAGGNPYTVLQYQSSPNFYGNFGSQQGWTPDNGFQILKSTSTDAFASILGFGDDGIVVGPQAFAPGATAASSYLIPFAAGNNSGWSQSVDIRTFTDVSGKTIDLNHDGIADFVGMGPQGLAFAFGNDNGPSGSYQLGPLQNAQINGSADDLGEAQGWTDSTTLRYVVFDPQTGYDDIIAFGNAGVLVAPGQDPATHNGQPFGQLYLAMPDFGANQGWSVGQTPRLVGDVNGDGVPDIVGFGASNTFVALGTRDAGGALHFALAPNQTIGDFGFTEGWSGSNPQTIRALANFPNLGGTGGTHADLVLSGAFNTQVWQFG